MSETYKRTCKYLNYVEHLLILASVITSCISISAFASLVCVPGGITSSAFTSLVCVHGGITSSAVWSKICAIAAGIKKYKSIIKKKKKKVLISKSLIESYISHDEFASVNNNVLREYNGMKEEIKNPETSVECII